MNHRPNIILVFTDDWGYGDLGVFKNLSDVKTPHLDKLSQRGVLFTDAYITAPQCSPSRAGLLTGRYQQRFGFDTIPDCPLPLNQLTLADRLRKEGYVAGMVGKWHLEPNSLSLKWARENQPDGIRGRRVTVRRDLTLPYLPQARGFDEFFMGQRNRYWCNFDLAGSDLNRGGEFVDEDRFRVDVQTDAGLAFIRRNKARPFFLYLAYYAPHVPLEAPERYLGRFPGEMPERRRTGLAMINAVDEGVGRIMKLLQDEGIADNTLIMFTSDNGAPLGAHAGKVMADILPVDKPGPAWDGSRNDPLTGEKGMLAEGGIRVPMIWSWPSRLPRGTIVSDPVISLDMTASALAAAGVSDRSALDGVDLVPILSGRQVKPPERNLYWRFWNQAAIRSGDWKYIVTGSGRELLFNLRDDKEEQHDLLTQQRERAVAMRAQLSQWTDQLRPPGLPSAPPNGQETRWYAHYFEASD
jgi:arylsulfatase A-like enzyme